MGKRRAHKKLKVLTVFRVNHRPPLSIRAAAAKAGVDRSTWWRWERGVRIPDRDYLPKLARLTGASISELQGFRA